MSLVQFAIIGYVYEKGPTAPDDLHDAFLTEGALANEFCPLSEEIYAAIRKLTESGVCAFTRSMKVGLNPNRPRTKSEPLP